MPVYYSSPFKGNVVGVTEGWVQSSYQIKSNKKFHDYSLPDNPTNLKESEWMSLTEYTSNGSFYGPNNIGNTPRVGSGMVMFFTGGDPSKTVDKILNRSHKFMMKLKFLDGRESNWVHLVHESI